MPPVYTSIGRSPERAEVVCVGRVDRVVKCSVSIALEVASFFPTCLYQVKDWVSSTSQIFVAGPVVSTTLHRPAYALAL